MMNGTSPSLFDRVSPEAAIDYLYGIARDSYNSGNKELPTYSFKLDGNLLLAKAQLSIDPLRKTVELNLPVTKDISLLDIQSVFFLLSEEVMLSETTS